ncbi:MAG: aldehyde dehydrogenase family protein [Polyangiaceae bacterium]
MATPTNVTAPESSASFPIPDGTLWVGGVRREGTRADVRDPWTGDVVAEVTLADAKAIEEATRAAEHGFERLRRLPSIERKNVLRRIAAAIAARHEELARLLVRECGKPITHARAEVTRGIATFELAAEESVRLVGETMPLDVTAASIGYSGRWTRVPTGPVLGIAPFNFPLNLVAHKVAPALAAGASIVLKPPPQAPLAALALASIVRESGAPPGSLEVVPTTNELAETMVRDDRFKVLSFTGSAKVGFALKAIAGKKRVVLELGGNAAVIVHEDANVPVALDRIVNGAFGYAGQVCIKVQRLFVARSIAEDVVAALVERTRKIAPADPFDDSTVLGAMIDEANAVRVERWVEEGHAAGGRLLVRPRRDGAKLSPAVVEFASDAPGVKIVDEEVFGPVLTVHRYDTWDEALARVDATRYGLQAGIFTDSHACIEKAYRDLHVGGLVVNDVPTFRVDVMPYGGMRDSGIGREGVRFAMEDMTERKLMVVRDLSELPAR